MDGARLLPVVGVLFWALPLLWGTQTDNATGGTSGTTTSGAMLYLFGVWIGLVWLSLWLSRLLGRALENDAENTGVNKTGPDDTGPDE